MITEELLRQNILDMRRQSCQIAFCVAVGPEGKWLAGQMLAGIPVIEYPMPSPPGAYFLIGAPVDEPGLACAELGAE